MSFLYGLIDLLLTALITLDTLGLVGQFRNKRSTDTKDYTRVCFTWIFYLTLKSFTPNVGEGTMGKIIGILFLLAKIFVTIPLLGGTMLIYNQAPKLISKGVDFAKSKIGTPSSVSDEIKSDASKMPSDAPSDAPSDMPSSSTLQPRGTGLAEDDEEIEKAKEDK